MAEIYGLWKEEFTDLKWDAIDIQYKSLTINYIVTETIVDGKRTKIELGII